MKESRTEHIQEIIHSRIKDFRSLVGRGLDRYRYQRIVFSVRLQLARDVRRLCEDLGSPA